MKTIIVLAALAAATVSAQVRRPSPDRFGGGSETVPAAIALHVGGDSYAFTGDASCVYLERGSIYDLMASRWSVQQSDGNRSLALTVWHPANGSADMINLSVSTGPGTQHSVDTVKVGSNGTVKGSGTAKFEKAGAGGLFTVDATTASGTKINGTIKCERFTAAVVAGGN